MNPDILSFMSERRFGTETEILSADRRNFKLRPLNSDRGEMPEGIDSFALTISDVIKQEVVLRHWHLTHNNNSWVLKPDSSCGIEICSPVSKGWLGLQKICRVTQALAAHPIAAVDDRCGFHVHVDVGDIGFEGVGAILCYWIKFEHLFMDAMPDLRKRNRYCQAICMSSIDVEAHISIPDLIRRLGINKYYSINTWHMNKGKRQTIEFRIMDSGACLNAFTIKNWVRLLLHFVERSRLQDVPPQYEPNRKESSLCWLDLNDFMEFMQFNQSLSGGMIQMRNWFLARIRANINSKLSGIWTPNARIIIKEQLDTIWSKLDLGDSEQYLNPTDMEKALYATETKS